LAADDPASATTGDVPSGFVLNGDADRGATIYARSCAVCHGVRGDGDGKVKLPDVEMPDLRDTYTMEMRNERDLYLVVKVGGGCNERISDIMPSTGNRLSEQDIHDVVSYVKQMPTQAYIDRQRNQ
jgi:mono/diheme cytochrome c family protein